MAQQLRDIDLANSILHDTLGLILGNSEQYSNEFDFRVDEVWIMKLVRWNSTLCADSFIDTWCEKQLYRYKIRELKIDILVKRELGKDCPCVHEEGREYQNTDKRIWNESVIAAVGRLSYGVCDWSLPHQILESKINSRRRRYSKCEWCSNRLSNKINEVKRRWDERKSRINV